MAKGVSYQEVLKELQRELDTRISIFPNWVKNGKMTQKTADHRIKCLEVAIEIIKEARSNTPGEQQTLFE